MINVFLLLGSNMGNREGYLQQAVQLIGERIAPVSKLSAVYETQSWGKTDEADYLNQVLVIATDLPAILILARVLDIELQIGRTRHIKWGARIIDIDILFYGEAIINEPGLTIPHPELHKRRFTLEPLGELAPYFNHPILNKTILQLKKELKDDLIVKKV